MQNTIFVDPTEMKAFMDMHGYPFGPVLGPFSFPRYPPSLGMVRGTAPNPAKLKERLIKESPLFSMRLNDFGRMYLRRASGLLELNTALFPPGHPMYEQGVNASMQDENDSLKKENLELRKRIEEITKNRKHV